MKNRNFRYDTRDGVTVSAALIVLEDHQFDPVTEGPVLFVYEMYDTDAEGKRFLSDHERRFLSEGEADEYFERSVATAFSSATYHEGL